MKEFNENLDNIDEYISKNYPSSSLLKPKKKIEIDSSESESESEEKKSVVKKTRVPRKQAEKKKYEKEGQRYDTPLKEDSSRLYYESL